MLAKFLDLRVYLWQREQLAGLTHCGELLLPNSERANSVLMDIKTQGKRTLRCNGVASEITSIPGPITLVAKPREDIF